MSTKNRMTKCVVCGTEYEGCQYCDRLNSWKKFTDTIEHYKIFWILKDFGEKKINKAAAKEKLENLNTTGWENWNAGSKNLMTEIMSEDIDKTTATPKKRVTKKKVATKVNDDENL